MTSEMPPVEKPTFGKEIVDLCRLLEAWHKEETLRLESDPNELPETNWRVIAQALFFLGAGGLVVLLQSWTSFVRDDATLGFYSALLAICGVVGFVLILRGHGMFKGRFWRALRHSFTKRSNYPFTPLIYRAERDVAALPRLGQFSDDVLKAAAERLSSSEARFRDGLSLLGGDSSLPTLAALAAGAWGAWKSYTGPTSLSTAALAGAIGVVWLAAYAFNLRFSLLELARCRDLIALELARRQAVATRHDLTMP